jgi:hypothetical protein
VRVRPELSRHHAGLSILASLTIGASGLLTGCSVEDKAVRVRIDSSITDAVASRASTDPGARASSDERSLVFGRRTTGEVLRATRTSDGFSVTPIGDVARAATTAADQFSWSVREQAGLLGVASIGTSTYVAWTGASGRLRVSELGSGRVVWNGTTTAQRAIGGHLAVRDGLLVLGLGELTGWAEDHGSGALVTLDPEGVPDQDPVVLSDGWNNPFAFDVTADGAIWVADNAPDGGPERIGRADPAAAGDDADPVDLPAPQRAPSALAVLPDGRLVVCGFLDKELRRYEVVPNGTASATIERSGTIPGTCATAVAAFGDGSLFIGDAEGIAWSPA